MNGLKGLKLSRGIIIITAVISILFSAGSVYFYFTSLNQQKVIQKTEGEFVNGIRADVYPTIPIQHPGKIVIKNLGDNSTRELDAFGVPISGKFVFFKDGKEVPYPAQFDEVIPIVEVELIPSDKDGKSVSPGGALNFQTKEYGEGHKLLRSSSTPIPSMKK